MKSHTLTFLGHCVFYSSIITVGWQFGLVVTRWHRST